MTTKNTSNAARKAGHILTDEPISINLHRLTGDERGVEASTRYLRQENGRYFVVSGESEGEALVNLASEIGCWVNQLKVEFRGFKKVPTEVVDECIKNTPEMAASPLVRHESETAEAAARHINYVFRVADNRFKITKVSNFSSVPHYGFENLDFPSIPCGWIPVAFVSELEAP